MEILLTILLSLRASFKENLGCTSEDSVYGKTLRLQGEFFDNTQADSYPTQLVEHICHHMRRLKSKPTVPDVKQAVYVHKNLKTCKHVFVRRDSIRHSLQAPCDEQFLVLKQSDKLFKVNVNGKSSTVFIDRLKPAFMTNTDSDNTPRAT
ncbi:pol polyprotein [Nephila pilipes]|uniref:Pol polyprotein n=1 Tax=Nephila pilipes TaxID=299642 RepID=A0A8X6PJQ4_NEPPI|nr:pol polyprotein [Nephila pilipes]